MDLIPPSQSYQSPARDVLEVIEVGGEEVNGDDEDEDVIVGEEHAEEVDEEAGCGDVSTW